MRTSHSYPVALSCLGCLALLSVLGPSRVFAQSAPGQYFYAIEDLSDGSIVRRGSFQLSDRSTASTLPAGGLPRGSVILAPERRYRYWLLDATTLDVGQREFQILQSGQSWNVGHVRLGDSLAFDEDGDGLRDDVELIIGTDPSSRDSDGDGIEDGAEVAQGLDPLDGIPARTGVIATADTPGIAVDICAVNDMAIVADSDRGVSIFNIFNGMDPVIVAQVDTPGDAQRVASTGRFVVVADGDAGLMVIDIARPAEARILHRLPFESAVRTVAAEAGLAAVALAQSELALVDLESGTPFERLPMPALPVDLAFGGDLLYVLTGAELLAVSYTGDAPGIIGSAVSPTVTTPNQRLFVGGAIAYAVHGKGANAFSLDDPAQPMLIAAANTGQFGWKQLVLNGSGLALAAVSPNEAFDGPHNVSLLDATDPADTGVLVTEFTTPGIARSVSIYNGLGYVADHGNGLQVINYLQYDDQGEPPEITLATSFPPASAEEGKLVRVTATVNDDVQVRNVEFHIDGVKVFTDGNFPFEYRFVTPRIAQQAAFTLRARASDTGGNATWTDELTVELEADVTAPHITRVIPPAGGFRRGVSAVAAFFNEPLDPATVTAESFVLTAEGGPVTALAVEYREAASGAFLSLAEDLAPGIYQARLTTAVADPAGNSLASEETWSFTVYEAGEDDTDGDCLPDAVEVAIGLNPASTDSDADGRPDSDEDADGDGASNCDEILRGLAIDLADTDDDGALDGEELVLQIDPLVPDTDGDGFLDGEEIASGSDPARADSTPVALTATVREATASPVAVLNETDPTAPPLREAVGSSVAVLQQGAPPAEPIREAVGASVSVRNDTP